MFDLDIFNYSIITLMGLIWGSFGNVVIHRLPLDQSVVKPRSRCPKCLNPIAWFDNVPVISWIFLRGKCRHCSTRISFRYPLVEILMAVAFAMSFYYSGWSVQLFEWILFSFGLIVCSFIDLDHMILPDEFTLSGIVIGLLGAVINPDRTVMDAVIGVLIGGGFLWLMAYLYYVVTGQEGMGGGDIKLLAWIGAVLGWKAIPFCIMFSAVLGSGVGLFFAAKSKTGLKTVIPFGPYLALSAIVFMFGGKSLGLWYLSLFLPEFSQ